MVYDGGMLWFMFLGCVEVWFCVGFGFCLRG